MESLNRQNIQQNSYLKMVIVDVGKLLNQSEPTFEKTTCLHHFGVVLIFLNKPSVPAVPECSMTSVGEIPSI